VIEKLTKEMFSENVNSKFRILLEGLDPLEAELVEYTEITTSPRQEQFSAVFRGPLNIFLNQGLYGFEHDKIGQFVLFLVPIRKDDEGFYYEAAFNRLIKKDE
jgi:hypothetical protein